MAYLLFHALFRLEVKTPIGIELPTFSIDNMLLVSKVEMHLCTERAPIPQLSPHTHRVDWGCFILMCIVLKQIAARKKNLNYWSGRKKGHLLAITDIHVPKED